MSWNTICLEGFCFGKEENGKYPCGKHFPTADCLNNGHCPHFAYGVSNEREVSIFVPFYQLLWDRMVAWFIRLKNWLTWHLWGTLWFNRRKVREFFASIPVADNSNLACKQWDESRTKAEKDFKKWLEAEKEAGNDTERC